MISAWKNSGQGAQCAPYLLRRFGCHSEPPKVVKNLGIRDPSPAAQGDKK
jgi:hypothetical protein